MEFNNIGYFQFDNLLRNRIPMLLVMLEEVDLSSWYDSLVKMHIQNCMAICQPDEVPALIQSKKLPSHFGIVVIDKSGQKSPDVVKALEALGFTNVFYIKNGFIGLSEERFQEK